MVINVYCVRNFHEAKYILPFGPAGGLDDRWRNGEIQQ